MKEGFKRMLEMPVWSLRKGCSTEVTSELRWAGFPGTVMPKSPTVGDMGRGAQHKVWEVGRSTIIQVERATAKGEWEVLGKWCREGTWSDAGSLAAGDQRKANWDQLSHRTGAGKFPVKGQTIDTSGIVGQQAKSWILCKFDITEKKTNTKYLLMKFKI